MAIKTFTTAEVLTAADTNTYLANSGLVYITSGTVTSGSSYLEILNCFSATYDNYRIVMNNWQTSASQSIGWYLGTNASATGYYGSIYYDQYSGGATGTARADNATFAFCTLSESVVANGSCAFDLTGPFLSSYTNSFGTYNARNFSGWHGALLNNTTSYTGIRFRNETGTLTAGKVRIYGYRQV